MRIHSSLSHVSRLTCLSILVFGLLLGWARITSAQVGGSAPGGPAAPPPEPNLKINRVVESQVAVNSTITIVIDDLDKWLQQQPDHDYRKFVLYMDGNALRPNGVSSAVLQPALIDVKGDKGVVQKALRFDLVRKPENRESWTAVLGRRRPGEFTNRNVYITVQQDGVRVLGQAEVNLRVIDWTWFWLFIVLSLAFVALCFLLCIKSDMIRVPGAEPTGLNDRNQPNRKIYSLARTQMAFWFFVVIISYVFIWMATGYLSNLPASVLTLIGISAATGLGSAVVDANKKTDKENLLKALQDKKQMAEAERDKLISEITGLKAAISVMPAPPDIDQKRSDLATKEGQLSATKTEIDQNENDINPLSAELKPKASQGFINDILSDDDGVSFHRLQIFGWTLVLILIFIVSVYDVLSMPDFDSTLLALMGISGGTYIGFKLPAQPG